MADVFLATCEALPDGDPDTAVLADALARSGLEVAVVAWDDGTVDWSRVPPTVIRSTWDYPGRLGEYLRWASSVPRLHNPAGLVRWNTDKRYLLELGERVPTVESLPVVDPSSGDVRRALRRKGWREGVLKPSIGLDGYGMTRVSIDSASDAVWSGEWILQPFVPEARTGGETSVVLVEGRPTHAVRRLPPVHDFRAQERLGGRVEPLVPTTEATTLAVDAVRWIRPVPLYARVDLVRYRGTYRVMELELTEPSLFFATSREGLAAMVEAVRRLVDGGGGGRSRSPGSAVG